LVLEAPKEVGYADAVWKLESQTANDMDYSPHVKAWEPGAVRAKEDRCHLPRVWQRVNSTFLCFFVQLMPSTDWIKCLKSLCHFYLCEDKFLWYTFTKTIHCNWLKAAADLRIHLSSIKPDSKEICKKSETLLLFTSSRLC
jgi:hypothetical protein